MSRYESIRLRLQQYKQHEAVPSICISPVYQLSCLVPSGVTTSLNRVITDWLLDPAYVGVRNPSRSLLLPY